MPDELLRGRTELRGGTDHHLVVIGGAPPQVLRSRLGHDPAERSTELCGGVAGAADHQRIAVQRAAHRQPAQDLSGVVDEVPVHPLRGVVDVDRGRRVEPAQRVRVGVTAGLTAAQDQQVGYDVGPGGTAVRSGREPDVSGWLLAARLLEPLHRITDTARRIANAPAADRGLHERIALDGPDDEIKQLPTCST